MCIRDRARICHDDDWLIDWYVPERRSSAQITTCWPDAEEPVVADRSHHQRQLIAVAENDEVGAMPALSLIHISEPTRPY